MSSTLKDCKICAEPINQVEDSVVLFCSCLVLLCQKCCRQKLIHEGGFYNKAIVCPKCETPTEVKRILANGDGLDDIKWALVQKAFTHNKTACPSRTRPHKSLISLLQSSGAVSLDQRDQDELITMVARRECQRQLQVKGRLDADCRNPDEEIIFCSNAFLERVLMFLYEPPVQFRVKTACQVCFQDMASAESVLLTCSCVEAIMCLSCAYNNLANQNDTYRHGLQCIYCKRRCQVLDGIEDALAYEGELMAKAYTYFNMKPEANEVKSLRRLYGLFSSVGLRGTFDHEATDKEYSVEFLRLEVARLEMARVNFLQRTKTESREWLGPLSRLRFQKHKFLEMFLVPGQMDWKMFHDVPLNPFASRKCSRGALESIEWENRGVAEGIKAAYNERLLQYHEKPSSFVARKWTASRRVDLEDLTLAMDLEGGQDTPFIDRHAKAFQAPAAPPPVPSHHDRSTTPMDLERFGHMNIATEKRPATPTPSRGPVPPPSCSFNAPAAPLDPLADGQSQPLIEQPVYTSELKKTIEEDWSLRRGDRAIEKYLEEAPPRPHHGRYYDKREDEHRRGRGERFGHREGPEQPQRKPDREREPRRHDKDRDEHRPRKDAELRDRAKESGSREHVSLEDRRERTRHHSPSYFFIDRRGSRPLQPTDGPATAAVPRLPSPPRSPGPIPLGPPPGPQERRLPCPYPNEKEVKHLPAYNREVPDYTPAPLVPVVDVSDDLEARQTALRSMCEALAVTFSATDQFEVFLPASKKGAKATPQSFSFAVRLYFDPAFAIREQFPECARLTLCDQAGKEYFSTSLRAFSGKTVLPMLGNLITTQIGLNGQRFQRFFNAQGFPVKKKSTLEELGVTSQSTILLRITKGKVPTDEDKEEC